MPLLVFLTKLLMLLISNIAIQINSKIPEKKAVNQMQYYFV